MSMNTETHHPGLFAGILAAVLFGYAPVVCAQGLAQSILQANWPKLGSSDWIAQGADHPRHILYEFIDPNCSYCHQLWEEMQPHYEHGLQVRYILVGIISESSPVKAAAILEAADPARALRQNERLWGENPDGSAGGGIQPVKYLDFSMLVKLRQHERLTDAFGIIGTPGLVWKDTHDQIHVLQSAPLPDELMRIIESATGG